MKCIKLILLLLAFICSVAAEFDSNLLQTFASATQNVTISDSCQEALQLYVANLQSDTDTWALRMLDATSKIPVGILSLNMGELGQFTECLATESEDGLIQGKYCINNIPLAAISAIVGKQMAPLHEKFHYIRQTSRIITNLRDAEVDDASSSQTGILWAICLPSKCSDRDIDEILGSTIGIKTANCQTKEDLSPPLTAGAISTIVVLSIVAYLLVFSTALDLYYKHVHKEPPHIILVAFSVYSNGQKLFRINNNSNELTCLNGIRFLSMMWVIIGHVYSVTSAMPLLNYSDVAIWADALRSMTILSGTLSVDSFLLLSGLLVVYSFMKAKHHGVKFNIFQFYIHRYLRLTPVLAATVLISAHLLKYIGSGPIWQSVSSFEGACQKCWWRTLLYFQNYGTDDVCLGQTWYLSVDMQLYVIAPLILYPLWKYPKIGIGLTVSCIITFIIVPFCIGYINDLPALLTNFYSQQKVTEYMNTYYIKTHTRAAPWFIGVFIGYILARIKFQGGHKQLTLNKIIIIIVWMVCIAVGLTCVYGGHSTLRGAKFDKWGNSLYIALVRPVWSVCLAWVIYACVIGYGGPVNWILSLPIYQALNRLTYSVYLIHFPLLYVCGYMRKTGIYFDEFSLAYSFWGITMFSFGLSILWVLAFESPIVILEKIIFSGLKKKSKPEENENKSPLPA